MWNKSKIHNIQINAERTKQKQHRHNTTQCNIKKFDIKCTHIMQSLYNKTAGEKNFCTHYGSFSNVRNSSTQ